MQYFRKFAVNFVSAKNTGDLDMTRSLTMFRENTKARSMVHCKMLVDTHGKMLVS